MLLECSYTSISFSKRQCLASSESGSGRLLSGSVGDSNQQDPIGNNGHAYCVLDLHNHLFYKKNLFFIFHTLGHCSVGGTRLGDFQRRWVSGEFRGGSRGSLEFPSGPKLFHFHREFKEICLKLGKRTPHFCI